MTADRTLHAIDATLAATTPEDTVTDPTHLDPIKNATASVPRFPADAELCVDTASGAEMWTGTEWNDYIAAAERNQSLIAIRLISIEKPGSPHPDQAADTPHRPEFDAYLTASDRVRLADRCHTADQHHAMSGDTADLRSLERANRELTAELERARGELADWMRAAQHARAERDLWITHHTNQRAELGAAQELADFRQGVNDSLRQDLSDAGDVIAAVREAAERLDRALAGRLPSLPDIRAAVEHIDRALAAYDTTPQADPGSPADRAQDDDLCPDPWHEQPNEPTEPCPSCGDPAPEDARP